MRIVNQLNLLISGTVLALAAFVSAENQSNKADTTQIDASAEVPAWVYPHARQLGPYQTVIHAPQIVDWDDFKQFKVLQVVEVSDPDRDKPILANINLSGKTSVNLDERIVTMTDIQVDDITFVNQETPGIGDRIDGLQWRLSWRGKQIYDQNGAVRIEIPRRMLPASDPAARFQVDGLSGATRTTQGVIKLLHYWLGEHGFKPYLQTFQSGEDKS